MLKRWQQLYKAPEPTTMKKGDFVRVAFDDHTALHGTSRWNHGKLSAVHKGGELVDICFDNGETSIAVPIFDVLRAARQ